MIMDIETRFIAGFYTHQLIAFDPRHDTSVSQAAVDWAQDYHPGPGKRTVPAIMLEATPGKKVPFVYHPDGIPDEVAALVERVT
jgi:hypothetical protein